MKYIKTLNEGSGIFGGSTADVMLPKIKALMDELEEVKAALNGSRKMPLDMSRVNKIERMYEYIIGNVPLEAVYKTLLQVRKKINPDAQ